MPKHILIICFFIWGSIGFAQDRIFKKDNTKLLGKVTEIGTREIVYRTWPLKDTSPVHIPIQLVAIIIYENGVSEVIRSEEPVVVVMPEPDELIKIIRQERNMRLDSLKKAKRASKKSLTLARKNFLYYNVFELIENSAGFSYTRNIFKNYVGIHVPVSFGYGTPIFSNGILDENKLEYKMDKKTVDAAIGINCYLYHFVNGSPYVGVVARAAQFRGEFNIGPYHDNFFTLNKYYYGLNAGFLLRRVNHFSFMADLQVGTYQNKYLSENKAASYLNYSITPGLYCNLSFQLGFSF